MTCLAAKAWTLFISDVRDTILQVSDDVDDRGIDGQLRIVLVVLVVDVIFLDHDGWIVSVCREL